MRLGYQRDAIGHPLDRKPGIRHRETKLIHTPSLIHTARGCPPAEVPLDAIATLAARKDHRVQGAPNEWGRPIASAIQINPASLRVCITQPVAQSLVCPAARDGPLC